MVALGHVVFTMREHVIAIVARGKGMLGVTLRYPYEIRNDADYFEQIPEGRVPKDMLDLAAYIVERKAGHFAPERFQDHYENALKELIKKKLHCEKIDKPHERSPATVISLMDALRKSVAADPRGSVGGARRAADPRRRAPAKRSRVRTCESKLIPY
jgi:DNA end-binding protein Ku